MKEIDFKQTPENVLAEITQVMYSEARTMNKLRPKQDADPVVIRDYGAKNRLILKGAYILRDLLYHDGKNIGEILRREAELGTSLYHCDVHDNLDRIMPAP